MAKSKQVYVQYPDGNVITTSLNPDIHHKTAKVLPNSEGEKLYKQQIAEDLRKMLSNGSTVYTILRAVSASGMSRKISVCWVNKEGRIVDLTYSTGIVCGYKQDAKTGGLIVNGCGMDMGFKVVYNLSYYLFKGIDNAGYELKHYWL